MTTVKTKICGIKTVEALDTAIDAGAYYVGLVFFPKSPRNVGIATAGRLAEHARNHDRGRAKVVALVVDPDDAALRQIMDHVAPDVIQLHGRETPDRTAEVAALTKRPVIKAISVATASDAMRGAIDYRLAADLVLFDAKPPVGAALPGGNGVAFDWSLIKEAKERTAYMLSGGLTPENVGEAIRQTGAYNVDVSSGVESAPGVKDAELIRRFLQAVNTAKQT
jgi:phosphoribosylanthranilate isomerase